MSAKIASEELASLGQFRLFLRWMLDGMTDQDHILQHLCHSGLRTLCHALA